MSLSLIFLETKTNTLKHELCWGSDFWGPPHWLSPTARPGPRSRRASPRSSRWCWRPKRRCWRAHLTSRVHLCQLFWKSFQLLHRWSDQRQLERLCLLSRRSPWLLRRAKILFGLRKKKKGFYILSEICWKFECCVHCHWPVFLNWHLNIWYWPWSEREQQVWLNNIEHVDVPYMLTYKSRKFLQFDFYSSQT